MGSYADAKTAVRTLFDAGWTSTRKVFQNEVPDAPWPPVAPAEGGSQFPTLLPFVFFEMATMPGQSLRGIGLPGDQLSQVNGFIFAHVFVPADSGDATATTHAEAIGELFRSKLIYEADGCYLRSWVPRVDEGGDGATASEIAGINAGSWFRVTMSVPFQYFHQG